MGYNVKAGVVERYASTLEQIKVCLEAGKPAIFTVDHPAHLAKLRDQLHWFLRCAKIFTDEAGGRYADLRDRVKVNVNWQERCISVAAMTGVPGQVVSSLLATPSHMAERDVLRVLAASSDAEPVVLYYSPSPLYKGDEWFIATVQQLGYTVEVHETDEFMVSKGLGSITCVATRKAKRSAFDIIKR